MVGDKVKVVAPLGDFEVWRGMMWRAMRSSAGFKSGWNGVHGATGQCWGEVGWGECRDQVGAARRADPSCGGQVRGSWLQ